MPSEIHFWNLLSKKLAGEATDTELKQLNQLLSTNPQWQFMYNQMNKKNKPTFSDMEAAEQAYAAHAIKMQLQGNFDSEAGNQFTKQHHRPTIISKRRTLSIISGVAATFLLLVILWHKGTFTSKTHPAVAAQLNEILRNEVLTKKGSKTTIKLPDGTQVWLNADTKLSYPGNFLGSTREVFLEGEAYFDVVHDAAHPFIIHTDKINIRVLGTAFNVRSYSRDETTETSLIRGKIEVTFKDRPNEKFMLKPNEKLVLNNKIILLTPSKNSSSPEEPPAVAIRSLTRAKDSLIVETAWLNDELVFFNESLEQIALKIERRFNIAVVFKDDQVKSYRYSAIFDSEDVAKMMEVMSLSKKFNYNIEGKKLIIRK